MEFTELMKAFGASFGLDDFKSAEDGSWKIEIRGMRVAFTELADPARIRMRAQVCELPAKGRETLLRTMLESMFMGQATGGASFSVDEGSDDVYLEQTESLATLDPGAFEASLERFANVLSQWRGIVARFEPVAGEKEEAGRSAAEEMRQAESAGFLRI